MCTPSRHRRLVLAYDSNPSCDGSVLVSATPPARHHHCPPTPLRPRPQPWQGLTRALAQVQQQPVQQQQLVQQRVITLAQAVGGRHVLQDGSLWTCPIGKPRVSKEGGEWPRAQLHYYVPSEHALGVYE